MKQVAFGVVCAMVVVVLAAIVAFGIYFKP